MANFVADKQRAKWENAKHKTDSKHHFKTRGFQYVLHSEFQDQCSFSNLVIVIVLRRHWDFMGVLMWQLRA